MTFSQDIFTMLSQELGTIFQNEVYAHNLQPNWDVTKPVLVYQYRLSERVGTIAGYSGQDDYELTLVIISPDSETNDTLATQVAQILEDYNDPANRIADINLVDDLNSIDFEAELYIKSMNYTVTYNN